MSGGSHFRTAHKQALALHTCAPFHHAPDVSNKWGLKNYFRASSQGELFSDAESGDAADEQQGSKKIVMPREEVVTMGGRTRRRALSSTDVDVGAGASGMCHMPHAG